MIKYSEICNDCKHQGTDVCCDCPILNEECTCHIDPPCSRCVDNLFEEK
jgi:hypothetical protein